MNSRLLQRLTGKSRRKMKKMIILIIFCFFLKTGYSQTLNDSLYHHLYNYSFIKNGLTKNNIEESGMGSFERFFNIQELVKNTNSDAFKIYTFRSSHFELPERDILIVDNGMYGLYDVDCLVSLIKKILDSDVNFETMTLWIKEIIKIKTDDHFTIFLNGEKIYTWGFGNFSYFIPASIYENRSEIE